MIGKADCLRVFSLSEPSCQKKCLPFVRTLTFFFRTHNVIIILTNWYAIKTQPLLQYLEFNNIAEYDFYDHLMIQILKVFLLPLHGQLDKVNFYFTKVMFTADITIINLFCTAIYRQFRRDLWKKSPRKI